MKKLIVAVVVSFMALFSTGSASAQDFSFSGARALGLRFGPDLAVSYQHNFRQGMFLEANVNLPYRFNKFGLDLTNNWVFDMNASNFQWYVGLGAGLGFNSASFTLDVVPRIGIEYNFDGAPIQLAVDYKPALGYTFGGDNFHYNYYNFGLAVRYRF